MDDLPPLALLFPFSLLLTLFSISVIWEWLPNLIFFSVSTFLSSVLVGLHFSLRFSISILEESLDHFEFFFALILRIWLFSSSSPCGSFVLHFCIVSFSLAERGVSRYWWGETWWGLSYAVIMTYVTTICSYLVSISKIGSLFSTNGSKFLGSPWDKASNGLL